MNNQSSEAHKPHQESVNPHLDRLKENKLLACVSKLVGLAVPVGSCFLFANLSFGAWSFTQPGPCYAVEYPYTEQYSSDPSTQDEFAGLKSIDVTARFSSLVWAGFIIELLLSIFVVLGLMRGQRMAGLGNLVGFGSMIWFGWLLIGRYDHYGRVCSGDFLAERSEETTFPDLQNAASLVQLYI